MLVVVVLVVELVILLVMFEVQVLLVELMIIMLLTLPPMSRAVTDKLLAAEIDQQVVAVVADTPTVNYGHEEGAVYWIARILDKQLLFIQCQHHTEELVPKAVMAHVSGRPSTSPADALFVKWEANFTNLQVSQSHRAATIG